MPGADEDRLLLERKFAELCAQVREYPTPIARCDDQLTGLIEARAKAQAELEALESREACGPDARWTNDGGMNAA